MGTNAVNRVINQLRRTAFRQDATGLTDAELLEHYLSRRDEAAFEGLVRRHGPMVLGVCRRILRNEADAEDAFQATFLVFVRKAGSIRSRQTLSNWLYGVAHNTALKARAMNGKRQVKEWQAGAMPKHEAQSEVWHELQTLLDAELSKLPDKYRIPIVLCDLEGVTHKEAARRLGWPQGTVTTRLTRGRAQLAKRLTKHELTLSGSVIAAVLSHGMASANPSLALIGSTTKAASLIAAGQVAASGVVSMKVAALTEGVMKSMLLTKLKILVSLVLAGALVGVSWGAYQTHGPSTPNESDEIAKPGTPRSAALIAPAKEKEKRIDDADKTSLPKGHAPVQVLASLDKDGKLVVKTAIRKSRGNEVSDGPASGIGEAPAKAVTTLHSQTYDLDDVQVLDTMGRTVDKNDLAKLLKEENVAMASYGGEPVDPLHFRVLKDGTLTLVLPGQKPEDGLHPDIAPADAFLPRPKAGPPADVLLPGMDIPPPMPVGPAINPDSVPQPIPPSTPKSLHSPF
jgi:RNA polymerase sigma-70 factor (ECF subfamily)